MTPGSSSAVALASDGTSCVPADANSPLPNVALASDGTPCVLADANPPTPNVALASDGTPTSSSPYDAEIKALISYRRQCVRPGGAIRNFPDEQKKAYQMVIKAINRLLKKAEQDGHYEAVAIVKANLKMGKVFSWEGSRGREVEGSRGERGQRVRFPPRP